jgi:rRNA maturation endonuclease Nob1
MRKVIHKGEPGHPLQRSRHAGHNITKSVRPRGWCSICQDFTKEPPTGICKQCGAKMEFNQDYVEIDNSL